MIWQETWLQKEINKQIRGREYQRTEEVYNQKRAERRKKLKLKRSKTQVKEGYKIKDKKKECLYIFYINSISKVRSKLKIILCNLPLFH